MRKLIFLCRGAGADPVLLRGQAIAAPPKVVKAVPDNGDRDVDPNVKEIRITFDQPMGEGMSVVGGGESFPEMPGKPRWGNSRTFVIPVKLQPNHDYWLSINSDRFQNFTNRGWRTGGAVSDPVSHRSGEGRRGRSGGRQRRRKQRSRRVTIAAR